MSLMSDSVMLIYCDFDGDAAEHDHWHSYEHLHERLSIPGFLRGTRWARDDASPRYMIVYEVEGLGVADSQPYLTRLNDPTPWTASIMPRLRRMTRGFCRVRSSTGYGLGGTALSMRFGLSPARESGALDWLSGQALPGMGSHPGVVSVHLFEPGPRPAMTKEQSLRGRDAEMGWVVFATGYDRDALRSAAAEHFAGDVLERHAVAPGAEIATFTLQHTVTSLEAARSAPNPPRTHRESS